jgi:hypothetical protein
MMHKGYRPGKDSVKFIDDSYLREASKITSPVTVYYGGKSGKGVRIDIEFRSSIYEFKINIRDKQGKSGYPSHIMMDYVYL